MKHLSVIISALFSILCIGCIKEDYNTGNTSVPLKRDDLNISY